MKKKVLVLALIMANACQVTPLYAYEMLETTSIESGIMPLYQNVQSIRTDIENTNGEIFCGVSVILMRQGTIDITMKLQRYENGSWKTIKTWNDSKETTKFDYSESTTLSDISDLRVQSTTKVTVNGVVETITQTDEL